MTRRTILCPAAARAAVRRAGLVARRAALLALAAAAAATVGCRSIHSTWDAIPAYRLPASERCGEGRDPVPVGLALLGQPQPAQRPVVPGDVLSVYAYGVLPPDADQAPVVMSQGQVGSADYYPPYGSIRLPAFGIPLTVEADGTLALPLVDPVPVAGRSLAEVRDAVRDAYRAAGILQKGRERVTVTLLRPRVHRVLVLRGDVGSEAPTLITKGSVPYTRRGQGDVVDLPAFENDILHALTATGGLPGIEAEDEVWVLRAPAAGAGPAAIDAAAAAVAGGADVQKILGPLQDCREVIKIPLDRLPDGGLPFAPGDVVLRDGDVVYVPPRNEFFYTGGLLVGGQIPLPKDRDLDVIEAITLAGGSVGGPSGASGVVGFRAGAAVGNIIPPTRVLVLRKLPDGSQLPIRVDLARAVRDPVERIAIRPDDVVFLYYKPAEQLGNAALNFFNFGIGFSPGR